MHDAVAAKVLPEAFRKCLRRDVVLREGLERARELGLVRDVGDGLPAAQPPERRRFPYGGDQRFRVWVVAHRLEDVRLEHAYAAVRGATVAAPAVLGEHLVPYEEFARLHELPRLLAEFADVVFPLARKGPIWYHSGVAVLPLREAFGGFVRLRGLARKRREGGVLQLPQQEGKRQ